MVYYYDYDFFFVRAVTSCTAETGREDGKDKPTESPAGVVPGVDDILSSEKSGFNPAAPP